MFVEEGFRLKIRDIENGYLLVIPEEFEVEGDCEECDYEPEVEIRNREIAYVTEIEGDCEENGKEKLLALRDLLNRIMDELGEFSSKYDRYALRVIVEDRKGVNGSVVEVD